MTSESAQLMTGLSFLWMIWGLGIMALGIINSSKIKYRLGAALTIIGGLCLGYFVQELTG